MSRHFIPPNGLTAIFNPEEPTLDIVFVHGFTGHPVRTWTHNKGDASQQDPDESEVSEPLRKKPKLNLFSRSQQQENCHPTTYWPRDLVPSTIPNARVLTYGYDTRIRHKAGPSGSRDTTVYDIAWDFLVALEAERRAESSRPIIFVVHSLGGIVIKEMLRRSSDCYQSQTHLRDIYISTIGIMFFGTPHSGADPRTFFHHIAEKFFKALGFSVDEQIVNSLLPSSERLKELRDSFGPRAYEQNWIIHSFQEQLGLTALGGHKVVEDTSSYLSLPAIEITEHIGRNHMDMCRFTGPNDIEYRKVASALHRMTTTIPGRPRREEKPQISDRQTRELLESLRFDQISARQMTIKKAHAKTCKWLFTKSEYLDWLDQAKLSEHHGFLWIKGKPGTGKSTLMKSFLANTKRLMKDKVVISFFFNARGEDLEKSTLGTYQSLLLQLLERLPTLESVFETVDLSVRANEATYKWSVDSLKTLLEEAILRLGDTSVVFLIDALDECDERQIRDMISFLEHIGELTVSANISFHVCFSSRHYPHITIKRGISLILEGQEGHTQDITSYLESELNIGRSKVAKEVRGEIQEKASGVFLWVVLVVEILNKEYDSGRIRVLQRRLREIPDDLHSLFNEILTRDSRNQDELILCVQWVLFARHPLTPDELYFAIISGSEPQDLSIWDHDEISMSDIQRFILNASKGLVETTTSKSPKVQFIHESVKDFLVKENGLGRIWPDLESNLEGQSHEKLKRSCVNYLNFDFAAHVGVERDLSKASSEEAVKLRNSVTVTLPFLEHATHHVLYHADKAEGLGVAQASFLYDFQLTRWIWLNNLFEKHQVRRHTKKASLLYILAEYDMSNLIRVHPSALSFFEIGDERYGFPLLASIATGSNRALKTFLQVCAANQPSGSRLQHLCLHYCREGGEGAKFGLNFQFPKHGDVISTMVRLGDNTLFAIAYEMLDINRDTEPEHGGILLSLTAETGHDRIAKQLLAHNAGIEVADWKGRTPLASAAAYGQGAVVNLLLENKAAIDSRDVNKRTPLMQAVANGHEAVVTMLLENKAEIESKNTVGQTSLMLAAGRGHQAIVKVLLENKAAIESKDNGGETPLILAATKGYKDVVKLLLENKAAVNLQDNDGWTPLMRASANGHTAVVTMLLEKNAVIDLKDNQGRSSLFHAVSSDNVNTVKLLLETDNLDVDSKNHDDDTPLMIAILHGFVTITKLLLGAGKVDVNSKNRRCDTPLSIAANKGNRTICKMLLDTGKVETNSKNDRGDTPLVIAAQRGFDDIAGMLLDTGKVDVNSRNRYGYTPLALAALNGHVSIAKLLLDTAKVDLNSKGRYDDTPLELAVKRGSIGVVKLLLDTGKVDVHARNKAGKTAQTIAAGIGNPSMIQLLDNHVALQTGATL